MQSLDPAVLVTIATELPKWLHAVESTFEVMRQLNTFGHQIGEVVFDYRHPDPCGQMVYYPKVY